MFSKIVLALWSAAGLIWWLVAWRLVVNDNRNRAGNIASGPNSPRSLSIFKPLPPLGEKGLGALAAALDSFLIQLDPQSELLLGIHEADRDAVAAFVKRVRADFSPARVKVIFRSEPDAVANPKIAWQQILARHAEGELWLWSDADIIAPPDFLRSARSEYTQSGAAMMTFPYVIRELPSPPALLEALFVNIEFYPGVLLLRRKGPVDFGLGAGMLFQRDDFLQRVGWDKLGACLADDFVLGQKLGPVRVSAACLTTVAASTTWKDALLHDMRWTKTIRWNRPGGAFARIVILPVLGWAAYAVWHPSHAFGWAGLVILMQADVFFAVVICRVVRCRLDLGDLPNMEIWSLWRVILWFLCWLPLPVVWSGKRWAGPNGDI